MLPNHIFDINMDLQVGWSCVYQNIKCKQFRKKLKSTILPDKIGLTLAWLDKTAILIDS